MTTTGARLLADLTRRGIDVELVEPGAPMPTVPMAAAAIGVSETAIVKSVLFEDRLGTVVLAIANGTNRISRSALAAATGVAKLWLASPPLVLDRTGFPAGGVAPVGHATALPVVIDRRVMDEAWVYGGAGSEDSLLKIRPDDIVALTGARVAEIVEPAG
jgi:prolyl-tRNA editing enzyme YbaK/EbsC (Cys-tRNA(Pro) deacylase)